MLEFRASTNCTLSSSLDHKPLSSPFILGKCLRGDEDSKEETMGSFAALGGFWAVPARPDFEQ
ncbi:unnamed protein product, partial [Eruca vesicaria subsp. sativa]|nr:unnamed protein product [Eruca vesicaria subsp. sativa]